VIWPFGCAFKMYSFAHNLICGSWICLGFFVSCMKFYQLSNEYLILYNGFVVWENISFEGTVVMTSVFVDVILVFL